MNLVFFSDVHGVADNVEKLFFAADRHHANHLILLGDILYHGPRNGVPGYYNPEKTAALLNGRKEQIISVRGNCDTEVDQCMLQFPILADFSQILLPNRKIFITHGHLWHERNLPPLSRGDILAHGHTHIPELTKITEPGITILNPGSISLPKRNYPQSYALMQNGGISVRSLEDDTVLFVLR